ncbi:hypothetical protein C8R48DRAFT_669300 [Suillus tomentosus]|nr:hypothetical protein C8R48DRAFT_669300 [Suillus tomentosus]
MSQVEDGSHASMSSQAEGNPQPPASSLAVATSESARQRRKIAQLEEKLQLLESGQAAKQRETNYCVSKGRAIRRVVTLYDTIEDLINENDRRQDRLQMGYIALNNALPWFHQKATEMEYDDYMHMLKKLRQGADSARGDDTSKLKSLVADWVNREFKPNPPVDREDKYCRGFVNDACGQLLCPTELDWNNPTVKAGIRDRVEGHIVTEMSWPVFLYQGYTADANNLEEGLFKSRLLVQAFKAIFTSPSSAKEVAGDGDGANIIENNRRAKRDISGKRVKTHVAQIIKMHKVSPWSIAYVACQLRFAFIRKNLLAKISIIFDKIQELGLISILRRIRKII